LRVPYAMPATAARAGRIYRARPIAIEILIAAEGFGNVSLEVRRVGSLDEVGCDGRTKARQGCKVFVDEPARAGRTRKHGAAEGNSKVDD
jgi:hypothetical protein